MRRKATRSFFLLSFALILSWLLAQGEGLVPPSAGRLNPAMAGGGPVVGPVPLAVLGLYGGLGAGGLLLARWRPPRGSGVAWQENSLAATGGTAPGQARSNAARRR